MMAPPDSFKYAIALMVCALPSTITAQPMYSQGHRPVMLSAEKDVDPCSLAHVENVALDEAVLVFPGDSTDLEAIDTLHFGQAIWVCDSSEDSGMIGIVYTDTEGTDCEVSSPVQESLPYLGPCNWGWIKSELISIVAG